MSSSVRVPRWICSLLGFCLLFWVTSIGAQASVSVVTVRSGITTVGTVDWGSLGAAFTVVPQPAIVPIAGIGGASVSATMAVSGSFQRRDQTTAGWAGNFASGDHLLWTNGIATTMILTFNVTVEGAGAQIQRNFFGPFTATIQAFDSLNNLLGSFTVPGSSTSAGDNSAIFLGVSSTATDIKKITYSVDSGATDFAIDGLVVGPGNGIACADHTVHGHIVTTPPDPHDGDSHAHHGQHGHSIQPGAECLPPGHHVIAGGHILGAPPNRGAPPAGRPSDGPPALSAGASEQLWAPGVDKPIMGLTPRSTEGVIPNVLIPVPEPDFVAALNQDGLNGPAARGTIVQLFGSARGLYLDLADLRPALGFTPSSSGSPLYYTEAMPEVQIGGVKAEVLFSGLAPGLKGVWQINVRIPDGVQSGKVPVTIAYDGDAVTSVDLAVE